jgi:hypothetical protein
VEEKLMGQIELILAIESKAAGTSSDAARRRTITAKMRKAANAALESAKDNLIHAAQHRKPLGRLAKVYAAAFWKTIELAGERW